MKAGVMHGTKIYVRQILNDTPLDPICLTSSHFVPQSQIS